MAYKQTPNEIVSNWVWQNRRDLGMDQRELDCIISSIEDGYIPIDQLPSYGVDLPQEVLDSYQAALASQ